MICMKMLKFKAIALITLSFSVMTALAQSNDTLITFHKFSSSNLSVNNGSKIDSADFVRVVYPRDPVSKDYPVKEFYKDGKIKLMGQYESERYYKSKLGVFNGDVISYYPTGKRRSFTHYKAGKKVGQEYLFYPAGLVQCSIVYSEGLLQKPKNWEFYTTKGDKICDKGNGRWITYDGNYKPIAEGEVKDGLFEGEWHGKTLEADSIRYTYIYKKGEFVSGVGYDKNGTSYSFKQYVEQSSISLRPFDYVEIITKYFKGLKDVNQRFIDTARVSFIIEKNGSLSSVKLVDNDNTLLNEYVKTALSQFKDVIPQKYYGIPIRTRMILPLRISSDMSLITENFIIEI